MKVLILEDEYLLAMLLSDILHDNGFGVAGMANSAEKARALLEASPVDAAILDFNLGGDTSGAFAMELRARGIPFLFITGLTDNQRIAEQFPEAPILLKPFKEEAVVAALKELLPRK